jgi:hypothetical protein
MKKMMAVIVVMATLGIFSSSTTVAKADTLYTAYNPSTWELSVEFIGSRIPTWGCNDVEGVQWDRLVLADDGRPQVYLEFYGNNAHEPVRLWVTRFPTSQRIGFWGSVGVPCWAEFQIRFLAWVNGVQKWCYWPISDFNATSLEPTVAEFHGLNVEIDHYHTVFRTICP